MDSIQTAARVTLCALAASTIPAFTPAAHADTGVDTWTAQQIVAATDGTSRVLWTADSTTGLGKTACVWTLSAAGSATSYGPVYGHYSDSNGDWLPTKLAVAADGTERLLWTNESAAGQEACVWTLSSTGSVTAYGPAYGPLSDSGGDWHAADIQTAPDGTTRLLWKYFGKAGVKTSLWSLDATGKATVQGPVYGPLSTNDGSWFPQKLAVAADGTTRLLWAINGPVSSTTGASTGDTVTIWTLNTTNTATHYGPAYGPTTNLALADFDVNKTDSTMRLLWAMTASSTVGDAISVWSLDATGTQKTVGTSTGPLAGWTAASLSALPDGSSQVEWLQNTTGYRSGGDTVSLWRFGSTGSTTFMGPVYGPISGWTLTDLSVSPADSTARLLWNRSDGVFTPWTLSTAGTAPVYGPVGGPYTF